MFSSFYTGDQGVENQLSILGVHEWRALSHFQVTWNNNGYIWTRQAVSFSIYKKKSVERYKVFIFSPFTKQVREIQEELDKLSPHNIKHTKKVWCNLIMINTYYF